MPSELSIAIGEWLYNLRSALDYLMWATAAHVSGRIPPPGEGQLQYPIYDTEAAWTSNLYRLKQVDEHHREMLKTMQPFGQAIPMRTTSGDQPPRPNRSPQTPQRRDRLHR